MVLPRFTSPMDTTWGVGITLSQIGGYTKVWPRLNPFFEKVWPHDSDRRSSTPEGLKMHPKTKVEPSEEVVELGHFVG